MPEGVAPAVASAAALLEEAVRGGLRDLVLCPGSRSQALALVAAELERQGELRLHVRLDERSAGFFALGLAAETGLPVPVLTTSGTAVANLHPALLEAFHTGIPLVALTADRPAELLGTGANQTTRQAGVFGELIPVIHVEAPEGAAGETEIASRVAARILRTTGPLHVNLAFREPLSSVLPPLAPPSPRPAAGPSGPLRGASSGSERDADIASGAHPAATLTLDPSDGVPTLVIAGSGAGPAAEQAAHEGGWPLIAEAASGARFGRNLVVAYRALLGPDSPAPALRDRVRRVIVFGRPTLSRELPALVERDDVHAIAVGPSGGEPFNPGHRIAVHVDHLAVVAGPAAPTTRAWLRDWVGVSRALLAAGSSDPQPPDLERARSWDPAERSRFARSEVAVARQSVDRAVLVDAVWRATWPHDRLVLGASRLIRELDARVPGKRIRVHANRGLAGIDGTIATGLGIATGSQFGGSATAAAGVTRVLLGDLALLHDAGSLLVAQGGEAAPRVQLIVGNDGGGTIFDGLEVAAHARPEALDRVLYTPQQVDLAALAAAYGWHHVRAATRAGLEAALTGHEHDRVVIEVPLER